MGVPGVDRLNPRLIADIGDGCPIAITEPVVIKVSYGPGRLFRSVDKPIEVQMSFVVS